MRQTLHDRLTSWSIRHPRRALGFGVGLCLLLALPALDLRLDGDARRLLPDSNPAVRDFRVLVERFGASEQTVVVVELPDDHAVDNDARARLGAAIDAAGASLAGLQWQRPGTTTTETMVTGITGLPDPARLQHIEDLLIAQTWLFLNTEQRARFVRALEPRRVERRLELGGRPDTPPHLQDRDPLGLWTDLFLPFWRQLMPSDTPLRRQDGYLVAQDGRTAVLLVRPRHPAQDGAFATAFANAIETMLEDLRAVPAHQGLRLDAVGGHLVAAADYHTARRAALATLAQGSLGILLLFLLVFRHLRLVGYLAITLIPASLAALGIARVLLGPELSLLIVAFAVVLIGLGVDFTIHLSSACARHLASGDDRPNAARAAMRELAGPIVTGAATSIAAFAVLGLSAFPGLRELGLVAACGLSVMLLQVLLTAPGHLARHARPARLAPQAGAYLGRWLGGRRLPGLLVVCAGLAVIAWDISSNPLSERFDGRARNLRPAADPLFERQARLSARLGLGVDQLHILVRGRDAEAVLSVAAQVAPRIAALVPDRVPPEWSALTAADPIAQRQTLAMLADTVDWDGLEQLRAADTSGRWEPFWRDVAVWRQRAQTQTPLTPDAWLDTPLNELVRNVWSRDGDDIVLALRFPPPERDGRRLSQSEIVAALDVDSLTSAVQIRLTGVPLLAQALADDLTADFQRLGWWSLALVVLILVVHLRSVRDASVALLVLVLGGLVTQGMLSVLGVRWNLINVAALPLLFGLGIDAAIYSVMALRRQASDAAGRAAAIAAVAPPLVMTTATTVVGFASLLTNPYRGLQSLGAVVITGMLVFLVLALTVPPLLRWGRQPRRDGTDVMPPKR